MNQRMELAGSSGQLALACLMTVGERCLDRPDAEGQLNDRPDEEGESHGPDSERSAEHPTDGQHHDLDQSSGQSDRGAVLGDTSHQTVSRPWAEVRPDV